MSNLKNYNKKTSENHIEKLDSKEANLLVTIGYSPEHGFITIYDPHMDNKMVVTALKESLKMLTE